MNIEIEGLSKRFDSYTALDKLSLRVQSGEFIALLGPSGSGKTTLLRILAGLEEPGAGRVLFGGEDALARSPRERGVGLVFQHYALFRHMTVFDNVAFGLKVRTRDRRPDRAEIERRVNELVDLVQLGGLARRYPSQLSGGQRQRVALARALAVEPKVLLLDEPFGALDAQVRSELRRWLRRLHDEMAITSLFVTHDQEEALELADRICIINRGKIEQIGSPTEVYDEPATPFVFQFLGKTNALACEIRQGIAHLGPFRLPAGNPIPDGPAVAYVRPHDVTILPQVVDGALPAIIRHSTVYGPRVRVDLDLGPHVIEAETSRERLSELDLQNGGACAVRLDRIRFFAGPPSLESAAAA